MFFPRNYPLYKATMDAYRKEEKVDFQSVEFRDAITDAVQNAMVANNQGDLHQARQERDRCLGAEGEMRGQVDTARGELGVSLVAEGRVRGQRDEARDVRGGLEGELRQSLVAEGRVRGQLEGTQRDRDEARAARDGSQNELVRSRAAEGRVKGQLDETQQARTGLQRDLTAVRDVLLESRVAEGQLRGQRDEARDARDEARVGRANLQNERDLALAARDASHNELVRSRAAEGRVQGQLNETRQARTGLKRDLGAVRDALLESRSAEGRARGQRDEARDRFQRDLRTCRDDLEKAKAAFHAEKDRFTQLEQIGTGVRQLLRGFRRDQISMGPDGAINFGNTQERINRVRQLMPGLDNIHEGLAWGVDEIIALVEGMTSTIQTNIRLRRSKTECDETLKECESKVKQLTEFLAEAAKNRDACEEELLKKTRELEDFQSRNPEPGDTGDSGGTVGAEDSEVPGGAPGESKDGDDGLFQTPRENTATTRTGPEPIVQDRSLQAQTPTHKIYNFEDNMHSELAFSILCNAWDEKTFENRYLFEKFGLPLVKHHPTYKEDLEAERNKYRDMGRRTRQSREDVANATILYKALGAWKARRPDTYRPIYTGRGDETFNLSTTTTFGLFFNVYKFLESESKYTDLLRNNFMLFVRVFLLVVKLCGVESSGVVIVGHERDNRDWHDEKKQREFWGIKPIMEASVEKRAQKQAASDAKGKTPAKKKWTKGLTPKTSRKAPATPGEGQETTGKVAKRLDFSTPAPRAPERTGVGGIYDVKENVTGIDMRARETERQYPLEDIADRFLRHLSGQTLTDKPDRILRLLSPSSYRLNSFGQYDLSEDSFDSPGLNRPVQTLSGGPTNLSETEAFQKFVTLRKYIISQGGQGWKEYTQGHFATVRLFLLVVRQMGLYFKDKDGMLQVVVRPVRRPADVAVSSDPSATSLLSNMFPWM